MGAVTLATCISIGAWLAGVPVHADPRASYLSHFRTLHEGHMMMIFLGVLLARQADLAVSSALRTATAGRPDALPYPATGCASAGSAAKAARTDRLH